MSPRRALCRRSPFSSGGVLALPSGTVAPLTVTNPYASPFSYFVSRDFGDAFQWFAVAPATAILEPGVAQALALDVRPAVAPGVRRGVLSVAFAGAPLQQVEVAAVQPVAEGCRATQLVTVLGAPAIDESLAVGQPVPVEAFVADDCGQRLLLARWLC